MEQSIASKAIKSFKNILLYHPPLTPAPFVLDEKSQEAVSPEAIPADKNLSLEINMLQNLIRLAKQLTVALENMRDCLNTASGPQTIAQFIDYIQLLEKQQLRIVPPLPPSRQVISPLLEENEDVINNLYHLPTNKDLVIRRFVIPSNPPFKAMLVFMDGLIDKQVINLSLLEPLMVFSHPIEPLGGDALFQEIMDRRLPTNQTKQAELFTDVVEGINSGDTALFIEGITKAIIVETKGFEHRSLGRPQNEQSVQGSQVSFSEVLRTNTGLIRTYLPTRDLVTEMLTVGDRTPVKCAVMYLKSLANPQLVAEVKRRVSNIATDYIVDANILQQFIEDNPNLPFPQSLATERPDRVAAHLAEGRVAIVLDGTPFVNIVPINLAALFHSSEDFSMKLPAGSFMRLLRLLSAAIAVLLPSFYLAISYFHPEALPTEIILAIAGAREKVPFPALLEVILMELSFEMIREAGLRVPGILGTTIGIVGAIILGQAAVAANIVSPIMVVIIAITGLASFAIPDYRLAFSLRLTRFLFLLLAATLGLVGLAAGLLVSTVLLCTIQSFGVSYLDPFAPKTHPGMDSILRGPVYRQERRPDALNPQDDRRQPPISRQWAHQPPAGEGKQS